MTCSMFCPSFCSDILLFNCGIVPVLLFQMSWIQVNLWMSVLVIIVSWWFFITFCFYSSSVSMKLNFSLLFDHMLLWWLFLFLVSLYYFYADDDIFLFHFFYCILTTALELRVIIDFYVCSSSVFVKLSISVMMMYSIGPIGTYISNSSVISICCLIGLLSSCFYYMFFMVLPSWKSTCTINSGSSWYSISPNE